MLRIGALVLLASCASQPAVQKPQRRPAEVRAEIVRLLPSKTADREGWATDIYAAFAALQIDATTQNLCATIAVTEQESTFTVNPAVPNLGQTALAEIDRRAEQHGIPALLVHGALLLKSSNGKSYGERIAAARTEQDLSRIYEELIGKVPLGQRLFASGNPVHTAGPMQVNIAFAEEQVRVRPYPYPISESLRHELFTRRGGMYFGIAHLLDYKAPYDRPLYRFADFNAGRYASRNAAFQGAVSEASGIPLALDGDLVSHDASAGGKPGATELAVRSIATKLGLDDSDIHSALEQDERADFEQNEVYRRVFALGDRLHGSRLPRALVPQIALKSPKISRKLTTQWYAERVDGRYQACMAKQAAYAKPQAR